MRGTASLPADYFETGHLVADLGSRSRRGGAVTITAQAVKFVVGVVQIVVLARLLSPGDFGLVAMVTAVTGFIAMFKDAGLSLATVQRERVTHAQISTLFWVNVVLSLGLVAVVAGLAPLLARFYSDPRLTLITVVIAGTFVLSGLTVQHQALLQRQMRFTSLAGIELTSLLVGTASAILLALFFEAGYWALVALHVVQTASYCILTWLVCRWRPGWPARRTGIRDMLSFGGAATAASFIGYAGNNLDKVLIGWWIGPGVLGLYDQAYRLMKLPVLQLTFPLARVAVPALSRCVSEPVRYRDGFLSSIRAIMGAWTPFAAVAVVCADWIIFVTLGAGWMDAAPIFRILAIASLILPLWNATGWLFVSQNRMREHLYFHSIDGPLKIIAVVIGLSWGIYGVSVMVAIEYFVAAVLLFWMVGRRGPIRTADFYRVLFVPCIASLSCGVSIVLLRHTVLDTSTPHVGLLVCLGVGAAFAGAALVLGTGGYTGIASLWRPASVRANAIR